MKSVIGLFENPQSADNAVHELDQSGFPAGGIHCFGGGKSGSGGVVNQLNSLGVPERDARLYEEGVRHGGTLVALVTDDVQADRAAKILNGNGAVDIARMVGGFGSPSYSSQTDTSGIQSTQSTSSSMQETSSIRSEESPTIRSETGQTNIPVVEEELRVGKREVETGGVRVSTHISETPVEEEVRLREEQVRIERRAVDRPATPGDLSARENETIELRETREEPVIQKEARVVEEVSIGKEARERTETVRDTVRRKDVDVEQLSGHRGEQDISFDSDDFRTYHQSAYQSGDVTYDWSEAEPAYRYGYGLRSDKRYAGKDWDAISNDIQTDWESKHPGTWDRFKDSIRYSWNKFRSKM